MSEFAKLEIDRTIPIYINQRKYLIVKDGQTDGTILIIEKLFFISNTKTFL